MSQIIRYDATREALFHPENMEALQLSDGPAVDLLCAEFSRLAYKKFERDPGSADEIKVALQKVGFDGFFPFSREGSQAFGTFNRVKNQVIVVFRGTEADDPTDILTDLKASKEPWSKGGEVHAGFAEAWGKISAEVEAWLATKREGHQDILFTGHSLGAALATLASSLHPESLLITFGSPLVGNDEFALVFAGHNVMRYVNCCDIVTRIPPHALGYEHIVGPRYIDRDGIIHFPPPNQDLIREDQEQARVFYLLKYTGYRGRVAVRDLADHSPINYVFAVGKMT
jgi:hypothetical protein